MKCLPIAITFLICATHVAVADRVTLPQVDVTLDVPAGWKLVHTESNGDLLQSLPSTVYAIFQPYPSCHDLFDRMTKDAPGSLEAKPSFLASSEWYAQVMTSTAAITTACAETPRGVLSVGFTPSGQEVPVILGALISAIDRPRDHVPADRVLVTGDNKLVLPGSGFDRWTAAPANDGSGGKADRIIRAGSPHVSLLIIDVDVSCAEAAPKLEGRAPAPEWVPAAYAREVSITTPSSVAVCLDLPGRSKQVLVSADPPVAAAVQAEISHVLEALATGSRPAAATVASSDTPTAAVPPPLAAAVDVTPAPTAPIDTAKRSDDDTSSVRARQLIAGLRVGAGYDTITPSAMATAASHFKVAQVMDSLPIGSGDLIGAATLGFGDTKAYDVQLDIGPTLRLESLALSAVVGIGYDQVDGTGMQFARPGGSYLQFLVQAALALGPVSLTGSTAILDHESRDTADLVWHVPSRYLHSLAAGVRYTDYETATRTGVMVTLGF